MALSIPQQQVFDSTKRFRVLITGRRFGKTHTAINEISKYARYRDKKPRLIWYIAPFYTQAKEIVWVDLKEQLIEKGWVKSSKSLNESSLSAVLINGNRIQLKGSNNAESLRGKGVHFMVLDEFQDIKESAWNEVLRPMLSDTKGHALFCATPKGYSWSYRLWLRGQKGSPDYNPEWESWKFTTLQGGNVSQQEIEDARKDLDERTFRQEYEASFESYAGIVYYAFDNILNVKPYNEPLDKHILHIGVDFNINPMTATIALDSNNITHVVDEINIFSSNTYELAEEIRNRYPNNYIIVYPDPACKQQRTSAMNNTDLKILQNGKYNFDVRVRGSHALIRDRVNAVNSRFKAVSGERRLFISPKCKTLIKCLTNQLYKEGTTIPDKDTGYDHMNDALGYHISYVYPVSDSVSGRSFSPLG